MPEEITSPEIESLKQVAEGYNRSIKAREAHAKNLRNPDEIREYEISTRQEKSNLAQINARIKELQKAPSKE